MDSHQEKIIEQFTRQAIPFAQVAGHHNALDVLIGLARPDRQDTVLDVACGPGIVACAFAGHCRSVVGLDVTPAMIEQAHNRQIEKGLTNVSWQLGTCLPLPYSDHAFSVATTRYSFHHFQQPAEVLAEMIRVCRPGGRVVVADVAMEPEKSQAFDQLEIMRDPSHVHALTTDEFEGLMRQSGLEDCRKAHYEVEIELEAQLRASFPLPGDVERLRTMITEDVGINRLGVAAQRKNGQIWYVVPVAAYVGVKRTGGV
jgi:ubiquinone/menaquinone biosynthesis C-methylase UbiE